MSEKSEVKKGESSLFEPIIDQLTTEYMRPALRQIPASVLIPLKKIGLTKALPIIGVALSALVRQGNYRWSDRLGDTISEGTAELRRIINEAAGEEGKSVSPEERVKVTEKIKRVISTLLSPELSDEFKELLQSLSKIFKDKDGKEKGQILALLEQLSPIELLGFLKAEKTDREILLSLFIKKVEEKSLEQSIKELKESLREFKARMEIIQEELFKPACSKIKPGFKKTAEKLKELDAKCAPDTTVGQKTIGFRSWAKRLRDNEKKKH